MQISGSKWQDLFLVVWSSCNRGTSLATICACRAARRSQTTIRPSNNILGGCFFVNIFSFFFSRAKQTRFGRCGWFVERHADQPKQVARLGPCGMVQLQPGYQPCNDPLLSCCASIANDKSASNNSLGEFFFGIIFSISLFSERERVSFVADCAWNDMQIRRSRWHDMCLVVWSSCNRGTSLAMIHSCRVARRSQTTSRPETTVSGNSFSVKYFFHFSFLFSQRENAFRLLRIARRFTCRSAEAGGKTCASWYGPVATGVPVLQRTALVVLRVDRKQQVGQQQQSRGILFR